MKKQFFLDQDTTNKWYVIDADEWMTWMNWKSSHPGESASNANLEYVKPVFGSQDQVMFTDYSICTILTTPSGAMEPIKPVNIFNLTPHPVQIWKDDKCILSIKPDQTPARVEEKIVQGGGIFADDDTLIPVQVVSYSEVKNLPAPRERTYYVVSILVAQACPDRDDLLIPYDLVRNEKGSIMGCRSLMVLDK